MAGLTGLISGESVSSKETSAKPVVESRRFMTSTGCHGFAFKKSLS
jgi:hypothetical protein